MKTVVEKVRETIERLLEEAKSLTLTKLEETEAVRKILDNLSKDERDGAMQYILDQRRTYQYQTWYTEALPIIKQLLPDRYHEFSEQYRLSKPSKTLDVTTYTISDFLNGVTVTQLGRPVFNVTVVYQQRLTNQSAILRSALQRLDSVATDIRTAIQAELLDDEIATARELLKAKHVRASGTVSAVALEAHLGSVAVAHSIKLTKKATLANLNDALKDHGIIDTPKWRHIGRLADIRNYCVHHKEREPSSEEVEDLITGAEHFIKTLF